MLFSSITAPIFTYLLLSLVGKMNNPVVRSTFYIWYQLRQNFKFLSPSSFSFILDSHLFTSADSVFQHWHRWFSVTIVTFISLFATQALSGHSIPIISHPNCVSALGFTIWVIIRVESQTFVSHAVWCIKLLFRAFFHYPLCRLSTALFVFLFSFCFFFLPFVQKSNKRKKLRHRMLWLDLCW